MKKTFILSVADLHYRKRQYAWLAAQAGKFDVICIAGDLLDMHTSAATGLRQQAAWVLDWIAAFPTDRTRLFVVSGNHDWWPGHGPIAEGRWRQRARRPGVYVDGDVVRHGGLTFACKPWNGPLALPVRAGPVVLVAHAPPEDAVVGSENGRGVGDFETRQLAASLPSPAGSLVLSGHAHHPDAFLGHVGRVACLNSGCTLTAPVPRHFVIDAGARWAWLFAGSALEAAFHY